MTLLNPYISFKDNTKQAMEFYQTVFGGKLDMTTFKDGGMGDGSENDNKIMHAMLRTDNGLIIMAADTPPVMQFQSIQGMSISLSGEDEGELKSYWDKLKEGAVIVMPLEKAPWGDTFGMLTDKFGVGWLVNINQHRA